MSRTLAFSTGIAVITVVLWLLFSPTPQSGDGGVPRTGDAVTTPGSPTPENPTLPGSGEPGQDQPAPADRAASDTTATTTNGPQVPPPIPGHNQPRPASITLWQPVAGGEIADADGFPATRLQADPGLLGTFHVGQELVINIPDLQQPVTARLDSTHNQLDSVQVFRGPVLDRGEHDNVIVTRGDTATYVVVSTNESVWSAVIDHRSGETLLTDERDILVRQRHDDYIPVPGIDQEPPAPENIVN